MERFFKSKTLICLLLAVFSSAMFLNALPAARSSQAEGGAGSEESAAIAAPSEESSPEMIEFEGEDKALKKKSKFPWLLVAGALVAGGIIYFVAVANKKCTLTTTVGAGVSGTPAAGTVKYKKGTVVSYSYAASGGFANLVVTLDGAPVPASGAVKMDKNHVLSATAAEMVMLTVSKRAGVNGSPESGTYSYAKGTTVNYNYSAAAGFTDLNVKLDGALVTASGAVTMNANHALTAEVANAYTLTVVRYDGVSGSPATGTYLYKKGMVVNYSYALLGDYTTLKVQRDGLAVPDSGSVTMNKDHTLHVWSWLLVSIEISADNQDACEDPAFHLSGDLLASPPNTFSGLVFVNVPIPKGAPIVSSSIGGWMIGYPGQGTSSLRATGFAEDNTPVFSVDSSNKPSTRPLTAHSVNFIPDYQSHWQDSNDVSEIIAEIITRPGWRTGNSIGFKLSSDSALVAFNGYKNGGNNFFLGVVYSTRIVSGQSQ